MRTRPRLIETTKDDSKAPAPPQTLRAIVREALLAVLSDPQGSAAAKASAGRTLLEHFSEENQGFNVRGADMTAAELDSAIARLKR